MLAILSDALFCLACTVAVVACDQYTFKPA
jgi:hypothetical protein